MLVWLWDSYSYNAYIPFFLFKWHTNCFFSGTYWHNVPLGCKWLEIGMNFTTPWPKKRFTTILPKTNTDGKYPVIFSLVVAVVMAMAAVVVVCLNQCCNPWSMPLPPPRTNPCKYGNRSPHPRENICITGTSESRCFLCSSFCAHVWLTICCCCFCCCLCLLFS